MSPVHISNSWIRKHLKYPDLFPSLRVALQDYSNSKIRHGDPDIVDCIQQPLRTRVPLPQGSLFTMPAYVKSSQALSVKILTDFPNNAPFRPSIQGIICLFHANEGHLVAMMDAEEITAKRTAAVSALGWQALRVLRGISHAKSPAIISIVGTGVQAEAHVYALLASLEATHSGEKCHEIRVYSRTKEKADAFCQARREDCESSINFKACSTLLECVVGSDVIFLGASSATPTLQCSSDELKKGCIIISVGACTMTQREICDEILENATIWVDCYEACRMEAGDLQNVFSSVMGEIGELLVMASQPQKDLNSLKKLENATRVDIIKTVGLALEDAVAAKRVYECYNVANSVV